MAQREGDSEEIVEGFDGDTFAANKSLHDGMQESPHHDDAIGALNHREKKGGMVQKKTPTLLPQRRH